MWLDGLSDGQEKRTGLEGLDGGQRRELLAASSPAAGWASILPGLGEARGCLLDMEAPGAPHTHQHR